METRAAGLSVLNYSLSVLWLAVRPATWMARCKLLLTQCVVEIATTAAAALDPVAQAAWDFGPAGRAIMLENKRHTQKLGVMFLYARRAPVSRVDPGAEPRQRPSPVVQ
jgi:hypothetical protein